MLLQLNIQNFAIVRSLDIDWQAGMTTITGETGAGKSIAIDALGLCLGERATTNIVRPHCKKAELAATFDTQKNPLAQNWLTSHDLNQAEEAQQYECILRRVISAEGRSRAYINGIQVPLAQLKEIGQLLINIHGQHDHQLLLKHSHQCLILDNYAGHNALLDDVKHYSEQWKKLDKELDQLQKSQLQREAQKQLTQYQVDELDEFALQDGEFATLESDYKKYSNAQDLLDTTLSVLDRLAESERFNIMNSLQECSDNINTLARVDNQLSDIAQLLSDSLIQLAEANTDLKHYYQQLELDPERHSLIEERYSTALQLAKKHQIAPEKLVSFHLTLKQELANIANDETRISSVITALDNTKQCYKEAAQLLTLSRQASATSLSKLISASMQELNMPDGQFLIQVEAGKTNAQGMKSSGVDEVSFKISLNPGQELESMNKVASGGELSRISLAMQVILADKVVTPTLIFDEVDVGISGPTAAMVGKKLQQLAQNTQVICVTHLPQVACKGHQQLFVSKFTAAEQTETKVTELSEQNRVKEIARLLAGDKISQHSLANAQELLAS